MKQLLVALLVCIGAWCRGQGIEQLAALRGLEHTVRQGYQLVTGGLQTIGDIREAEYRLHHNYFQSLYTVNKNFYAETNNGHGAEPADTRGQAAIHSRSGRTIGAGRGKADLAEGYAAGYVSGL